MSMSGPTRSNSDDEEPAVFGEINITPLTDIFLVLLIIFMVTSTALVEQGQSGAGAGVRVDLPKGAAKELAQQGKDFPITITAEGQIAVEGKSLDLDTLKARLAEVAKDSLDTQIIIQADEKALHGRVVEVIEAAKAAGLTRLAIATNSP
jgi:biopolymer transport protein ExbD